MIDRLFLRASLIIHSVHPAADTENYAMQDARQGTRGSVTIFRGSSSCSSVSSPPQKCTPWVLPSSYGGAEPMSA